MQVITHILVNPSVLQMSAFTVTTPDVAFVTHKDPSNQRFLYLQQDGNRDERVRELKDCLPCITS